MNRVLIIVFLAAAGIAQAQKTENRNVGSFKGVKASQAVDVYLKKGTKEAVRVEVSGNGEASDVITEVSGDYLRVQMSRGNHNNVDVKVYITYVELNKLASMSAANIFAEGTIKSDKLALSAASSGSIDVQVEVNDLEASAGSAGDIQLKGKATAVNLDAATAGEIDAYELTTDNATVEASTAGSVKVSVNKAIEARAATGGSVRYRGNPERSNTSSSTGGSVKKSS